MVMERGGNNSCRVSETRAGILPRHLIARLNGPLTERQLLERLQVQATQQDSSVCPRLLSQCLEIALHRVKQITIAVQHRLA
jgi:hypothetical protein